MEFGELVELGSWGVGEFMEFLEFVEFWSFGVPAVAVP